MRKLSYCLIIFIYCVICTTSNVNAQTFMPSAQQIQQFKNLPRAQQESLAKQMGFDISLLDSAGSKGADTNKTDNVDFVSRTLKDNQISQALSKQSIVSKSAAELKPFGYDIFDGRDSALLIGDNVPVPSNYIIGPGDSIKLQLFGKETGSFDLTVTHEGNIDLPDLGPLEVSGTNFQELKELVKSKYNEQKIGVTSFVSMGQIRTIQIFLVGEVYKPGPLVVSGLSSITTALINSGGVNTIGSLRKIELKRGGRTVAYFDLYDLIVRGDTSKDIRLEQGDVLFVPTAKNIVSIDGEVRRPAIYELVPNETIDDLIKLAGGLLPKADVKSLQLIRKNPNTGLSISNINTTKADNVNTPLKNGDFLRIPTANLEFNNAIIINGAINMPNMIADNNLSLSSIVTKNSLYSNTDLNYALLVRKGRFEEKSEIIQFKPIDVLNHGYDIELRAFDELVFFNRITSNSISGMKKEVVEGGLQTSQDDIRQEQGEYFQRIEISRFTSTNFTRVSSKNATRKELLAPVILRLKSEASKTQPVRLVEVNGEVKYPGIYPKPDSISLEQIINAAGGLTESAHLEEAEITRSEVINGSLEVRHSRINILEQLLLPIDKQVTFSSKDILTIARIPEWYDSNTITLRGEVTFPGVYQIKVGETLAEVIDRAGGLTANASPNAAIFTRLELAMRERKNIGRAVEDLRQQLANNSLSTNQFSKSIDYDTANQVLNDLTNIKPLGRIVIDLPSLLNGDEGADIVVKNGDTLVIPDVTSAVSVIGEVFVPVTLRFEKGITVEQYIELAGGVREYGDTSNIYIVKADGSVIRPETSFWFANNDKGILSPGDTIVIPRDVTNYENISLWQGVTQIVYQTAVALAAIGSL